MRGRGAAVEVLAAGRAVVLAAVAAAAVAAVTVAAMVAGQHACWHKPPFRSVTACGSPSFWLVFVTSWRLSPARLVSIEWMDSLLPAKPPVG